MSHTRDLLLGEHDLIGDIIADSFADDPVNQWVFGGQEAMLPFYTRVAKKLYLPQGYGHVMEDGAGGALWLPPGIKKDISLLNSLDIAASIIRHAGFGSLLRGLATDSALAKHKPVEPHYYLFAIGARSGKQGKGIGGKLMQTGLERVDSDGMPAYLESSKEANVPFYRRFGFEVIEEIVPAKGCPPLWLMWREARKTD
jgi:ribosomal protein S18 acetylase RimI-like enzyme